LHNKRNDSDVWDAPYDKASNIAAEFDIQPSRPRRAARQNHRANPDVNSVSDYWKVTLFYVFLDHLVQEIEFRILSNRDRFAAVSSADKNTPTSGRNASRHIRCLCSKSRTYI
jgi:hypothetical protein